MCMQSTPFCAVTTVQVQYMVGAVSWEIRAGDATEAIRLRIEREMVVWSPRFLHSASLFVHIYLY